MTPLPSFLLHEAFCINAAAFPAKTAIVVEGVPHSYAELAEQSLRLANFLRTEGLLRGDRVAIYMDNTWACAVSIYAALRAGAVFLVVNPQTKAEKLEYVLRDSDARLLLTDSHLAGAFKTAVEAVPTIERIVCSGKNIAHPLVVAFDAAVAAGADTALEERNIPLDLAALIYTSGSTGNPKGVMHTHQSMRFAVDSLTAYLRLGTDDRILCMLPFAFDYGLYQLLMAMSLGATLVLERSFTFPAKIFQRMHEQDVTVFPGVPTVFAMLLSIHGREPLHFPAVTRITNTAAALPDDFVPRLRQVFPNALIYRMYGLTECKRVSYLEPELAERLPGSVGKAIPGTEVYILDTAGAPVAPGATGVLYVRGPHVMTGYWKQPELTAHMLKPGRLPGERVLCTQDFFRMDSDGYLYFVGRNDDIIKTRGEKVSPAEVENVIHAIPGVREVAVIGIPDATLGQAICAYVVLDAELTEKQIRAGCSVHLENFMVPRDIVICDELPKTATGKVSRKALVERHTP